jgi:hypothetical protein
VVCSTENKKIKEIYGFETNKRWGLQGFTCTCFNTKYYNLLIPSHLSLIFIVQLRHKEGKKPIHKELPNPTPFVD